jgi:NPCBM/NEW2 domain
MFRTRVWLSRARAGAGGAICLLITLFAARAASAADEPAPAQVSSVVASEPVFSALLIDGTSVSGRVRQLGQNVTSLGESKDQAVPLDRLVKLTRDGFSPPNPPEGTQAMFPDGDRLRVVIDPATDTTLEARSYVLGAISIPLDSLLGLVLSPPADAQAFEDLLAKVRDQPRRSEVLWLANGDRLTGGFLGLNARQVSFKAQAGPVEIDRAQIVALGFDSSLVNYPRPKGDYFELTLTDGSRLGVSALRIEKGQVDAVSRFGVPIHFAIGDLARVHRRTESIAYLSEQPADGSEYESYIGPTRPYRRDAAVDGHALRLSGQAYDRGIGTQSRTLLAYRLKPGDRRFQALVGVDDRAGPLGSVVFRVKVDGKNRFVSPAMSVRDTPAAIDIDLTGARVLILVTEFGERGDVRDFADWVEARLIR